MSDYYPKQLVFDPVLSREEEDRLFMRIVRRAKGWRAARDRVFIAYSLYALSMVKRLSRPFLHVLSGSMIEEADLVAAANTGLLRAIDRFDPRKRKSSFATYSKHFIRGHVYALLRREVPRKLRTVSLDSIMEERMHAGLPPEPPIAGVQVDPWTPLHEADFRSYLQKIALRCKLTDRQKRFLLAMVDSGMNLDRVGVKFGYTRQRAQQVWIVLRAKMRDNLMRHLPLEEQRQLAELCC